MIRQLGGVVSAVVAGLLTSGDGPGSGHLRHRLPSSRRFLRHANDIVRRLPPGIGHLNRLDGVGHFSITEVEVLAAYSHTSQAAELGKRSASCI